ncbi:aminotransferase class IV [Euzebya tangerina]|uniref:aminotransferase class IV n=1 Tax=Euzebya tangerina TaxID=591198 RepID=UPI0013C351D5|nr:aminotransferase class IV [Euzebya tangerina]
MTIASSEPHAAPLPATRQTARINGVSCPLADAALAVTDAGVARGDGAFETVGVWGGRAFRLEDHLDRLEASAAAIALDPPPREDLLADARAVLDGVAADAALRLYVTATGSRIVTLSALPERGTVRVLSPQPAPWIQPPAAYHPAGAKTMSYGPNMTAGRLAVRDGADDALLISHPDAWILEGPTFGVVFASGGVLHAPSVDLGIVDSISRRTLLEIAGDRGIEVLYGHWPLAELATADEVIISSSLRPATAVARVGSWTFGEHPIADLLDRELRKRRREFSS